MDRIDALAEKIDAALRDPQSGGAAFDMLPAWVAEYEQVHGTTPGTSGGSTPLDHFMRESGMEQGNYDEEWSDGAGGGLARIGRATYQWDDAGFYRATLHPTLDAALAEMPADLEEEE